MTLITGAVDTLLLSRLFVHESFLEEEELKRSRKRAKKEPKKGAERKQEILDMLAENSAMTQTGIMEELKLTRKQVQNDIKELQKEGLLSREGSNRSGKWIVMKD